MSNDRDDQRLAEYELWERLETRLWRRARLIGGLLVLGMLTFLFVGVSLVRDGLSSRLRAELRPEIREQLDASRVDLPGLRKELRDDTTVLKEQLVAGELAMDRYKAELERQYEDIDVDFESMQKERAQLQTFQTQLAALQVKLERIKTEYEVALMKVSDVQRGYESASLRLTEETEQVKKALPRLMNTTLRNFEDIVLRELDELRMIMADHGAGNPALFSTYLDLDAGTGYVVGSNFGVTPGRIMLRVRGFRPQQENAVYESSSILMTPKTWDSSRVELDLTPDEIGKLRQLEQEVRSVNPKPPMVNYSFLVMRSDGKMSLWSRKWASSLIPPEPRGTGAEGDDATAQAQGTPDSESGQP